MPQTIDDIDQDLELEKRYHPENFEDDTDGKDYEPDPDLYLEDEL